MNQHLNEKEIATDEHKPVAWMHDNFVSTNKERVEHDEMRNRSCGFKEKPIVALYAEDVIIALRAELARAYDEIYKQVRRSGFVFDRDLCERAMRTK